MYNAQTVKKRIKATCKAQKIPMESMLIECGLGVNAVRQINDLKGIASFSLAKIADKLRCSTDYLLGRTELKSVPKTAEEVNTMEYYLKLKPELQAKINEAVQKAYTQQNLSE